MGLLGTIYQFFIEGNNVLFLPFYSFSAWKFSKEQQCCIPSAYFWEEKLATLIQYCRSQIAVSIRSLQYKKLSPSKTK